MTSLERRKDTPHKGVRIPKEYLEMIETLFNETFSKVLLGPTSDHEHFLVFGEMFPDEVLIAISLCPRPSEKDFRISRNTCYASIDYPVPVPAGSPAPSESEKLRTAVNACVDASASFFQTYFDEGRPLDYETEYHQGWTKIQLDSKAPVVYLSINRDNLELESAANLLLGDDFDETLTTPIDDTPTASTKSKTAKTTKPKPSLH